MLGPAELREIYDALHGMGLQPVRLPEGRSPYLSPTFAAGMAVTKALRGKLPAKAAEAGAEIPPPPAKGS
jgi:hypothetical protein